MMHRILVALLLFAPVATAEAASTLTESWLRVQQALASQDYDILEQRILEFQQVADDLADRRMTPYATALVRWAAGHSSPLSEAVVRQARVLDPELPSTYFFLARAQWQRREMTQAARTYVSGCWAMLIFESTRRALVASVGTWAIVVLGWTLLVTILVQTVQFFRRLFHDAVETGLLVFNRPNALVAAVVFLAVPLVIGLGPMWLLMYLFAMSWVYMGMRQKVTAAASCCLLALMMPSLWLWHSWAGQPPTLMKRVDTMLDERRVDPSTVREFSGFEGDFEGVAAYHMVLGELVRMHGDADAARFQFQKAAVYDDGDPSPLIFLGNLAMEEGDIQRAIQQYNSAIELDPQSVLAFHNLSFAYDQSRRFEEGDEARDIARRLAGDRKGSPGIRGRDDRVRYPLLGKDMLRNLADGETAEVLDDRGPSLQPEDVVEQLMVPASQVFWISALLGIIVLALRSQLESIAQICAKCGKVFCHRCKTSTESATYCSQCISVFLQRDMVSKEQQSAKQNQIRRWELRASIGRSILGSLIPGSLHVVDGSVILGVFFGFLAWMSLSGLLVWAPLVLPSVDPLIGVLPIQVVFGICCALLWIPSAVAAWSRG